MRPDIVLSEGGSVQLVADCKCKRLEPGEFKNHDVYQLLAYCTATQVHRGLLIYPVHAAVVEDMLKVCNTSTVIRQASLDLGKDIDELNQECTTFVQAVFDWIDAGVT